MAVGGPAAAMATGAASALGRGTSDVTQGELGGAVTEAGLGALVGRTAHGVGNLLGSGAKWLGGRAAKLGGVIDEMRAAREASATATGAQVASTKTQATNRILEQIRELGAKHPEALDALVKSGKIDAGLVARAEAEALARAAGRFGGAYAEQGAAQAAARELAEAQAARTLAGQAADKTVRAAVAPTAKYLTKVGKRAALGAGVGYLADGKDGILLGAALGGNVQLLPTLGRHAAAPAMRRLGYQAGGVLLKALGAQPLQRVGGAEVLEHAPAAILPRLRSALGLNGEDEEAQRLALAELERQDPALAQRVRAAATAVPWRSE